MKFIPNQKRSKPSNIVQSIEKAAEILDKLKRYPEGASLGEISHDVDQSKGTVHRLLATLTYLDFVRQDPVTKNYRLGFKLCELGNIVLGQLDLRNAARPFLDDLANRVRETVHLVVLDYDEALYIDKVEIRRKQSGLQMVSRIGGRIPLHSTSVGKILLASLPNETIDGIITSKGLVRKTANTITDPDVLKRHLEIVKKEGVAFDNEENEAGVRCVAATIFDMKGAVAASVSISGPAIRVSEDDIRNQLQNEIRKTAMEISKALGYQ